MITTLPAPQTDSKASHEKLLKAFDRQIDDALAFAALATELYALINKMALDLPEEKRDEFFGEWFERESYKKLEKMDAMIHAVVWD